MSADKFAGYNVRVPPRLPRPPTRQPSAHWLEDGPRSWTLNAGTLELFAVQGEDNRWSWVVLAGTKEIRPAGRRGTLSLTECKLAAEDWLRETAQAITAALG